MKKLTLYLILLILPYFAHSQNWQWAKQVGSNIIQSYDYGKVITDGAEYYVFGWYSNSLYLQTDTLNSNGTEGLYVIKYDSNGIEKWAKGFGGNASGQYDFQNVKPVYDSNCNCFYVAGEFGGEMILGNDTLISYPDSRGLYVAKMDLNGNFIWAHSINNSHYHPLGSIGNAEVFCSPNGIVYLTGSTIDTINFSGHTLYPGGFLLKFESSGNCIFARNLFSNPTNQVKLNFLGNEILMSGNFQDSMFSIDTVNILNNGIGSYDFYLSKADTNGNVIWLNHYGYGGYDYIGTLDVSQTSNEIYFCGGFQDSITVNGTKYYNQGKDIIFGKFDANGNAIWIEQCNAQNNVGGANSIKIDNEGNIYSDGYFSGTATFGSYSISSLNPYDMFLARYNSNGDCMGVRHFGYAASSNVTVDNSGNPICSGGFLNTVNIGNNTFTSNGYVDVFIAKSDIFTGIGEYDRITNNALNIYANPNQGKCNITVPDDFVNEKNLILSIYDNSGKLIQQSTIEMHDGKIKLNLQAEAKGIYSVVLSNGKKGYSGKIVFE